MLAGKACKLKAHATMFDYINNSVALAEIALHPFSSFPIRVDLDCGYSGAGLVGALHRNGIPTWTHTIDPYEGCYCFAVHRDDAEKAARILGELGVAWW